MEIKVQKTSDVVNRKNQNYKTITSIPQKMKISLSERFKEYAGENLAKKFSWNENIAKENEL